MYIGVSIEVESSKNGRSDFSSDMIVLFFVNIIKNPKIGAKL